MTDPDYVIKSLQASVDDDWLWMHAEHYALTMKRAIELVKRQKPISVKLELYANNNVLGGKCPVCNNWINRQYSFCGFCGQAVKWE